MDSTVEMTEEQIVAQQEKLKADLIRVRAAEVDALRDRIRVMAERRGLTYEAFVEVHVLGQSKPSRNASDKPKRGVLPAKYASPNDKTVTWSGAGKAPAWFKAALSAGYTEDMMEIPTPVPYSNGNGAAHA